MASRNHRRKTRVNNGYMPGIYKFVYLHTASIHLKPDICDIEKIRSYFYKCMDMLLNEDTVSDAIGILKDIIMSIKPQIEYYNTQECNDYLNILSKIDSTVLIVLQQTLGDDERLKYMYDQINTIHITIQNNLNPPNEFYNYKNHTISTMMIELINELIQLSETIHSTESIVYLEETKTHIKTMYGSCDTIYSIQDKIISIIDNIGQGVNRGIIAMRVGLIKELIGI